MPSDIAVYGPGVLGCNLAMSLADEGLRVGAYGRRASVTESFVNRLPPNAGIHGGCPPEGTIVDGEDPRIVFPIANPGKIVDRILDGLCALLTRGDIVIDGGNSYRRDTQRRWQTRRATGLRPFGTGMSGGEAGARLGPSIMPGDDPDAWPAVYDPLSTAKTVSPTQGVRQTGTTVHERDWPLAFGDIALSWRAGCIIRSRFPGDIRQARRRHPDLPSLMSDDWFADMSRAAEDGRESAALCGFTWGIPIPAPGSALSWCDSYCSEVLPANLFPAPRDCFGAHIYRRSDRGPAVSWYTRWTDDRGEKKTHG